MNMKKRSAAFYAALIAFSLLVSGCSKAGNEEPKTEVVLISEPEMEEILTNSGWDIQSTSAASFHLWEQLDPTILLLAENKNSEVLIIGEFNSSEEAEKAYESAVPLTDENVVASSTDGIRQALVPLGDDNGYWLFRQAGKCLMGGWIPSTENQPELESLFTSFQTNAPIQSEDPTIPSDDNSVTHGQSVNDLAQDSSQDQAADDGTADDGSEELPAE